MNKKKIICIILIVFCLVMIGYMVVINTVFNENVEIVNEYTPEVELSDTDSRRTIVTLYFENSEGKLASEARLIDSKELLREPYKALVSMIIEGPKDTSLSTAIPKDTKVLNTSLNGKCVTIDLSESFVNNAPESAAQKSNMIYSIVNTLTELKEVESVKFLVNGEAVSTFDKDGIILSGEFVRKE